MHCPNSSSAPSPSLTQLRPVTHFERNCSQILRLQPRNLVVLELLLKRPASKLGDPLRLCIQERLDLYRTCIALSFNDRKDLVVAKEAGADVESLRGGAMSWEERGGEGELTSIW